MMRDRLTPVLWALVDYLSTVVFVILVVVFLIAAKKPETPKETARTAGNISVAVFWQDDIDADVDTWLRSPDGDTVSFHHKSGTIWSLLRDDLGRVSDITPRNFENAYSRGLLPGEYTVNVNLYRNPAGGSIEVQAELRIQRDLNSGSSVTFPMRATLDRTGDETTLFRFSIDNDGNLVPGSVNNLFSPLAKEKK